MLQDDVKYALRALVIKVLMLNTQHLYTCMYAKIHYNILQSEFTSDVGDDLSSLSSRMCIYLLEKKNRRNTVTEVARIRNNFDES